MRTEIEQIYQIIGKLINEDLKTLERHIANKEYIIGALRDSEIDEQVIHTQVTLMENIIKFIEIQIAQGDVLSEYEAYLLENSKNLIEELKIDHKMKEQY